MCGEFKQLYFEVRVFQIKNKKINEVLFFFKLAWRVGMTFIGCSGNLAFVDVLGSNPGDTFLSFQIATH